MGIYLNKIILNTHIQYPEYLLKYTYYSEKLKLKKSNFQGTIQ